MNLEEHYNKLYKESIQKISTDNYEIDPMLRAHHDNRFGVSLLIRPPIEIRNEIQNFLQELKNIEPDQYYYPNSDIHITVLSIISCYDGLKLSNLNVPEYIELIGKSIDQTPRIKITFKGITASPSCIMIQGFLEEDGLKTMRDSLRREFRSSQLEQSMDERYVIQTAHATVFRFSEPLINKEVFMDVLEKYRSYDFGTFSVDNLELSYNDWYHREKLVTKLHEFKINNMDVHRQSD